MRVPLRGLQRGMSQELLHLTQIRSPVKHMRGGTVPQSMRANVGNAGITRAFVHHTTYHPLINAFALSPKKQRSRGLLPHQQGSAHHPATDVSLFAPERQMA